MKLVELYPYGVLCTAKRQIITDTAHLKVENVHKFVDRKQTC